MNTIPKLADIYAGYIAEMESKIEVTIPLFGKSFLRAMAGVLAAKDKLIYLAIASVQKNIFVDTADPESMGGTLERFGRVVLGRNPTAAQAGQYNIIVTGTIGAVIPYSMTFKSDDDSTSPGKLYVLDNAHTMTTIADTITIRALEAGLNSKLITGDKLTATAPIILVDGGVTVASESISPLAAESIEDYRTKAINSFRLEPQGGAATDYRLWAMDVAGVKTAYPYAITGYAGEINVYVEGPTGNGTVSSTIITNVGAAIEIDPNGTDVTNKGRRPLGVHQVRVLSVVPKTVTIAFTGFVGFSSISTQLLSAITAEIAKIRPFIAGIDTVAEQNDTLRKNKIYSIVYAVKPDAIFDSMDMTVGGISVDSYLFDNGEIPNLTTVTNV